MTVEENVAFGLQMRKKGKADISKKVSNLLEIVDLQDLSKRYPNELSGGQRQRVALARALVISPDILLLDEPLSNLDAKLRLRMRVEIREIQKKLGITTIFVTHDQEECFSISDKVAVMNQGIIEQFDSPETLYKKPATEFVARFVGFENFLPLTKHETGYHCNGIRFVVDHESDRQMANLQGTIRPEDILILQESQPEHNVIEGTLIVRPTSGKVINIKLKQPSESLSLMARDNIL